MSDSGSMFLFELIVSELKSFVKCKDFIIKSQFADVFSITLKDPKEIQKLIITKKGSGRKSKVRRNPLINKPEYKVQSGQSVLSTTNIDNLISYMKQYPIEVSLWSTIWRKYKVASTIIPWNQKYIDYLSKIRTAKKLLPVSTTAEYNVFDEVTSRRIAVIRLSIKLRYLSDKITTRFRSLSEEKPDYFIYTGFNSSPSTILSTVQDKSYRFAETELTKSTVQNNPINFNETGKFKSTVQDITMSLAETGIIKTIYDKKKKNTKGSNKTKILKEPDNNIKKDTPSKKTVSKNVNDNVKELSDNKNVNKSKISLCKSDTDIDKNKEIDLTKSKSCSSMDRDQLNILNYIFGDNIGPFGNQIYCVNYFTVENAASSSAKSSQKSTPKAASKDSKHSVNQHETDTIMFRKCDEDCVRSDDGTPSICSIDLPKELTDMTTFHKCKKVDCDSRTFRQLPPPPDDRILLDLSNLRRECCEKSEPTLEKVEQVIGGMVAKMKIGEKNPCFCECWCDFGFTKKTRYCKVCGGYEIIGEDIGKQTEKEPFPCPIYHNLEKPKTKPSITSDTKKVTKTKSAEKSIDSDKETKKGKKKSKNDKFKFNYGYTGIPPRIGHDYCAAPCTGTLGQVPKNMGWLWTADNIPGLKFRPMWKPGAVNKHVLRILRMSRHPGEAFTKKKRRKDLGKSKKNAKRPLLIVHKKDGEYTVEMETMKTYAKPRAINQAPYEEKPPITYTIGRTEEENRLRRLKKERAQRRLERCQREFIQSAFRDMCQEICVKTYQQALGILPGAEDPDCPCYPDEPGPDKTDLDHSCSCSEDSQLSGSETDSDEWIVEFTPPAATYDPAYKTKKVNYSDNGSQYTYLDYRVKLADRYGNPVPRFFKGLDGSEQCSDLGGFWGLDGKWLEINVDGFVAPDGKWCPNTFIGPDGDKVEAEIGKFQGTDGKWYVVGIDGYVDVNGKWRSYQTRDSKKRTPNKKGKTSKPAKTAIKNEEKKQLANKKSDTAWSCFEDATPQQLSKLGILGHGHDRKLLLETLNKLVAQGEDIQFPKSTGPPKNKRKKNEAHFQPSKVRYTDFYDGDKVRCKHATPSSKGVIATDGQGNKIYFRLNKFNKKKRSDKRLVNLSEQGRSVSSFHVPCFHSFIGTEAMKKELYNRRVAIAKKHGYVPNADTRTAYEKKYRNVLI